MDKEDLLILLGLLIFGVAFTWATLEFGLIEKIESV